ncbi:MMPL family transporter [Nocardia donostiensis]|uniref:RND transporter n=1 Tax=Nocardia donostiensis TaxID=1538463 RepID=A0A1V2TAP6_9NOCA|nr:MMPL family transporter [Nocardia donostiensis]ONM46586.1 RND transporter [Nocardia donostiensis]OQS19026.1 RND transporter [Nocardia donostiensis]
MFTRWGDLVYRLRFAVIGVVVAALLGLGGYGFGLGDHLSSSGWDDPTSESAQAARIADAAYGRNHDSDVIVLYTAPEGKTIHDPEFRDKIVENLNRLPREYPDQIAKVNGAYWATDTGPAAPSTFGSKDQKHTFASIAIVGDNDTEMVRNFRAVKDVFYIDGVDVQVAGLQAVAGTLNDTMADDQKRMELLAIPAVGVLLFFIFGGIVAAALPLIVGGLTVLGANGIIMILTNFTEVNSFVSGVVSMIGLGLAIDYGLFIVSRFREELAEGYDTPAAVRRSVMTAGRTVVFSATMIIASLGGILLFPQGFLKSVAYGTIATVTLAALASITVLPAMLGILGPRVDMLGLKRFRKTKSAEEVENSIWGRCTRWVMQHPLKIAIPISILLLLLIIPVKNLAFGGINERYLPPDNVTRLAQENFDEIFPLRKSDPIELVFVSDDTNAIAKVWREADKAPGLAGKFAVPSRSIEQPDVFRTTATLVDSDEADATIDYLRSLDVPDGVRMLVGGQPAIQQDSIDALVERIPLMIALVVFVTTLLMFLTFGSLVLPIKAALMSALGLGSTLGILTWIFIDGHGATLLNFTPQPIMSPVLVLIIAIIYGLSTDYEVFLLSRMVEARAQGASTTEAVRIGTAHTGRIITAAALILLVVTGAFAFSDLVMMQYIAYGMIAALFIDATILRMLLVPATMKLLGDDCWWAPEWMKKVQRKIGLGEPILDDERPTKGDVVDLVKTTPVTDPVTMQMPALPTNKQRKTPHRPRTVQEIEAEAPTAHLNAVPKKPSAPSSSPATPPPAGPPRRPRAVSNPAQPMPTSPDPTRPRANPPGGSGATPPRGRPDSGPTPPQGRSEPVAPPRGPRPAQRPPAGPTGNSGSHAPGGSAANPGGSAAGNGQVTGSSRQSPTGLFRLGADSDAGRAADHGTATPGRISGASHSTEATGAPESADQGNAPGTSLRLRTSAGSAGNTQMSAPRPVLDEHRPPAPQDFDPSGRRSAPHTPPSFDSPGQRNPSAAPESGPRTPSAAPPYNAPGQRNAPSPNPGHTPEADGQASAPMPRPLMPRISTPRAATTPLQAQQPDPEPVTRPAERPAPPASEPQTPRYSEPQYAEQPQEQPEQTTADQDNRNSIENWMAELRSSRRRVTPPSADEGRHHSNDGRTVSVNELLRRREQE